MAQDSNPQAAPAAATALPVEATAASPAAMSAVPTAVVDAATATVTLGADSNVLAQNNASAESLMKSDEALALTKMGFSHLLKDADVTGLTVLIILAVMSVLTWYYIFYNSFRLFVINRRYDGVMDNFWGANNAKDATVAMSAEPDYEPFSKIALSAADAASHHADAQGGRMAEALSRQEFIDRAIKQSTVRETAKLDSGLTLLATVGSVAPFVGLFGTVYGIYNALVSIGARGEASMDVVAGPVGEALIMTCIGLGVAIPSVLAYNFLVRGNNRMKVRIETFNKDLFDFFATGARVRLTKYGTRQSEPRVV
jgi:biopolymer transport protein ExbB